MKFNGRYDVFLGEVDSRIMVARISDKSHETTAPSEDFRVHYDMVRVHQALGKTSAEAADIAPLFGFKWLELLKLSTTRLETADKSQTASTR